MINGLRPRCWGFSWPSCRPRCSFSTRPPTALDWKFATHTLQGSAGGASARRSCRTWRPASRSWPSPGDADLRLAAPPGAEGGGGRIRTRRRAGAYPAPLTCTRAVVFRADDPLERVRQNERLSVDILMAKITFIQHNGTRADGRRPTRHVGHGDGREEPWCPASTPTAAAPAPAPPATSTSSRLGREGRCRATRWKRTCWICAFDVRDNSRLSCQIKVSDALDGLRVKVPEKRF